MIEVMRMFHASAVPDLAEPRKRTLLIAERTGAGLFVMTAIPSMLLAIFLNFAIRRLAATARTILMNQKSDGPDGHRQDDAAE
jgi:hypothetical protein